MEIIQINHETGDKYSVHIGDDIYELTKISRPHGSCFMAPSGNFMVYYESIDKWIVYRHYQPLPPGRLPGTERNFRLCSSDGVTLRKALALLLGIYIDK